MDSARYFILNSHGGFYADVDTEPLKSLELLLEKFPHAEMLLSEQPFKPLEARLLRPFVGARSIVTNAVMASSKEFYAWKPVLEALEANRRRFSFLRELNITYSTGPALVSGVLDSYARSDSSIVVLPSSYFEARFGFDPSFELEETLDIWNDRYVLHRQEATWHSPALKALFRRYLSVTNLFEKRKRNDLQ